MSTTFRTVTIAGATGNVGYHTAEAFLDDGSYKVKILRKKPENVNDKANVLSSKGAEIVFVDYDQENDLADALKGTDVLVSTVGTKDICIIQRKLLAAAKKAGVKRFIPSEYGVEHSPGTAILMKDKTMFQKEVEQSGLEYTFIYTGIFQEYLTMIAYDVKNKQAKFFVDGNAKLATTSLSDVGKYIVESLKIPEARNAHIRVSGATLTLDEYLQKFEEASDSKWEVIHEKEKKTYYDEIKAAIMENGSFESVDNDKFSFTPRPVTETINVLVKQAGTT